MSLNPSGGAFRLEDGRIGAIVSRLQINELKVRASTRRGKERGGARLKKSQDPCQARVDD